jgi:hypothetical protein
MTEVPYDVTRHKVLLLVASGRPLDWQGVEFQVLMQLVQFQWVEWLWTHHAYAITGTGSRYLNLYDIHNPHILFEMGSHGTS